MSGPVTSRVASMSMNRASSSATIVLVNGSVATMPLEPSPFEPSSQLAQITVIPNAALLHLHTTKGDHVAAELRNRWDPAPLGGRPVLYLDQNIWSTLFRRIHDPDRVDNADEADAAEQLIDLAMNRRVIVPYSAAHMSETTQWADHDQRYRLALTILQLSGGWQMRDALEVRCREMWAHLALRYRAYCVLPRPVFTLEPDAIHSGIRREPTEAPPDFPDDLAWLHRSMLSTLADFDTMLDAEWIPPGGVGAWADGLQSYTDWLADEPRDREQRRARTHTIFIGDLHTELARAAALARLTPENLSDWILHQSATALEAMPALGLFREVLHEKLINRDTRWKATDLTDLFYLTCAAGYADHVIGERSATGYIRRAQERLGRTVNVHRNLRSLMAPLDVPDEHPADG